jgi:hypothetical protein
MPRPNDQDLKKILQRPGYGIASSGGGIKGTLKAGAALHKAGGAGTVHDMESSLGYGSLYEEKLQVGYSGIPEVVITFYRRRLADYGESNSRAISEKALIDSLVYAGLIEGDSGEEIRLVDGGQKKVESNEEERTEITVFYPEIDLDNIWVKAKSHKGR